jgi:hypothetical protein
MTQPVGLPGVLGLPQADSTEPVPAGGVDDGAACSSS